MSEYYESKDYQSAEFKHSDDVEWTPDIENPDNMQLRIGERAIQLSRDDTTVFLNTHNPEIDHFMLERDKQKVIVWREVVTNFDEAAVEMAKQDYRFDDRHEAGKHMTNVYIAYKTSNLDEKWAKKSKEWGDNE